MPLPRSVPKAAIGEAVRKAALTEYRLGVVIVESHDGLLQKDEVTIYFPKQEKEPPRYHAKGTCADIIAVITESASFDELATNCERLSEK